MSTAANVPATATTAPTAPLALYGIPNCDTVKRARAWLEGQGMAVPFHDFKKQGVPAAELERWLQAVGWQAVVNRKGNTWRQLTAGEQAAVADPASARALALAQPSVIKRPVATWPDGGVTVGLQPLIDRALGVA